MKKNESLTKKTFVLTLGRTVGLVINILIPISLVRILSVSDFGTYKLIGTVTLFLTAVAPLGIVQSLYYFIPTNREHPDAVVNNTLLFLLASGGACALAGFVLHHANLLWFTRGFTPALFLATLLIFLTSLLNSIAPPYLISNNQTTAGAKYLALNDIVGATLIMVFAFWGRSISWVLAGWALAGLVMLVVTMSYFRRYMSLRIAKGLMKEQLNYALPFGLANIASMSQFYLHQFVISAFFTSAMFAIYSVGTFQLPLVRIWYSSVADIILVRITELRAKGDVAGVLSVWLNSVRKLALVFIPAMALMLIVSRDFITTVFTVQYTESIPIFIISLGQYLTYIVNCHSVLRAFDETKYILRINLVMLAITTIMLAGFVHFFGVVGAAVATTLAAYTSNGLMLVKIASILSIRVCQLFPWQDLWKIAILSIGSALIALLVAYPFPLAVLRLIVAGIVFSVAYLAGLWVIPGLLSREEQSTLRLLIHKMVGKTSLTRYEP